MGQPTPSARRTADLSAQLTRPRPSSHYQQPQVTSSMINADRAIVPATTTAEPDRLSALPEELKQQMFRMLFAPENNTTDRKGYLDYTFDLALGATNKSLGGAARLAFLNLNNLVIIRHEIADLSYAAIPVLTKNRSLVDTIEQRGLHSLEVVIVDQSPRVGPAPGARKTYASVILSSDLDKFCKDFSFDLYARSNSTMEGGTVTMDEVGRRSITRQAGKGDAVALFIKLSPGRGTRRTWEYKEKTFLRPFEQCKLPGLNVRILGSANNHYLTHAMQATMSPPTMCLEAEAWKLLGMLSDLKLRDVQFSKPELMEEYHIDVAVHACRAWEHGIFSNLQPAASYPPSLAKPLAHAAVIAMDLASTAIIGTLCSRPHHQQLFTSLFPVQDFFKDLQDNQNLLELKIMNGKPKHVGMAYCSLLMLATNGFLLKEITTNLPFPGAMGMCESLMNAIQAAAPEREDFRKALEGFRRIMVNTGELIAFNDGVMTAENVMWRLGVKSNKPFVPFKTESAYIFTVPEGL